MNVTALTKSRVAANLLRGEWLLMLHDGLIPASELIEFATTEEGAPLRRIQLWRLVASELNIGRTAAKQRCAVIQQSSGLSTTRQLTIGWLIDKRAGGKRLIAYANALRTPGPPWSGFPFTPKPGPKGAIK